MVKNVRRSLIQKLFLFILFQGIFAVVSSQLLKRVGAFGCFDDCFNFGAGNFLLQGKQLYSQIFFNHQPGMAYVSAAIQYITHPATLFELVKYHRIAALVFANICSSLFIFRFGMPMFFAGVVFEATKFYIFGDRFLAEGLVVYPIVYLFLLIGQVLMNKRIYKWEFLIAVVSSWAIFWSREPFMPLSVVLFVLLAILGWKQKEMKKMIVWSLSAFFFLHVLTVLLLPQAAYIFNVMTVNFEREVSVDPWTFTRILHMMFYPVFIIIHGFGSVFYNILFCLSVIFCLLIVYEVMWKKRYALAGLTVFLPALANIRAVPVGNLYYDAFHMIPWYGMLLGGITILSADIFKTMNIKNAVVYMLVTFGILGYVVVAPSSYMREKIDAAKEFNDGYGNYFVKGEVIRQLALVGDTMFVEMWEDPIYFVAGVPSAYAYAWYTSVMPFFPRYQAARTEMFARTPPTFYVGACGKDDTESPYLSLPDRLQYVQLYNSGKPSCLYIRKTVVQRITDEVSARMNIYGYSLP